MADRRVLDADPRDGGLPLVRDGVGAMSEHTPGPWRLAKEPPKIGLTTTLYGFGPKTLGTINTGNDEYFANARLIAAAPDLLQALCWLLADTQHRDHDCGDDSCPVATARAAIAKATGAPTVSTRAEP
jgi:hypothetical protein